MATSRRNIPSPPFPPRSNDGEPELESLTNSELFSFLESSFRRSEFITVARILQSREELAKAEALKDLEAKNDILEKELRSLRHNEAVGKLEQEIMEVKDRYLLLRGSYDKMEKLAREKIQVLMEEVGKERANCLKIEEQLNERIAEVDSWKSKYSVLEAWILHFLENNPHLVKKARKQDMNEEKQNMNFFRIHKSAGEMVKSNAVSDKKESFLAARTKSIDFCSIDVELTGASFGSGMKYSFDSSNKNCSKRKFQTAETSGVKKVLESDDEDDVICISELMVKRFAKRMKE